MGGGEWRWATTGAPTIRPIAKATGTSPALCTSTTDGRSRTPKRMDRMTPMVDDTGAEQRVGSEFVTLVDVFTKACQLGQ